MVEWKKLQKKIPFRVQLKKNVFYEIVWVNDFPDGDTMGETRYDQKQIAIKNNMSPKQTVTTYLHEIIHALSFEYDLGLTETKVQNAEKSLYFLLKHDNIFTKDKK